MATIQLTRKSKETDICLALNPDGTGQIELDTGFGFFDHFLTALCYYAGWDLNLKAQGDLEVDGHHLVEDAALALGTALTKSLAGQRRRFGKSLMPMDDALVMVALDTGGRPFFAHDIPSQAGAPNPFTGELAVEFFRGLTNAAGWCLHVRCLAGENGHHLLEALAKGTGLAIAEALEPVQQTGERSTKGQVKLGWELKP